MAVSYLPNNEKLNITANKTYALKDIVSEIQFPFFIRKPNFSSDFYCRADRIEQDKVVCTGFKNGKEYTARKYTYSLNDEVIFIKGEIKTNKTTSHEAEHSYDRHESTVTMGTGAARADNDSTKSILKSVLSGILKSEDSANQGESVNHKSKIAEALESLTRSKTEKTAFNFFSNQAIMNGTYYEILTDRLYNTKRIRTLVINYLALIKHKIRVIFGNDDFDMDNIDLFAHYFRAYDDCSLDEDDLSELSLFLADLFDFSISIYSCSGFNIDSKIISVLHVHSCEIKLNSQAFIPITEISGKITVFGVFALINTFLDSNERNSLSFDLLNESSSRSKYYLETLLNKSLVATSLSKNVKQEIEEKERTFLSLYIHRKLTEFYLASGHGSADAFIKEYIESAIFIGDSPEYTVGEIAESINRNYKNSPAAHRLIEDISAIAINRKYYNLIKWREMGDTGSFLKNSEKFCSKLLFIAENLFTEFDEMILCDLTDRRELRAINNEQAIELKELIKAESLNLETIHIQLYHVSDNIKDVMYDDCLLGNRNKWFFTFEQNEDNIIPEPEAGYEFVGWDSKVIGDSPVAKITLYNDCCIETQDYEEAPARTGSMDNSGAFEIVLSERNEVFNERDAQNFFKALELTEKSPEPCRAVFFTPKFNKSLQNLDPDIADKVELVKKKFAYLPDDELRKYLLSQNSKHLQGRRSGDIPFYKFRLSRSARLFFCYGSKLRIRGTEYPKGTVVLSEVVTDHDEQDSAGDTLIDRIVKFDEFTPSESGVEVNGRTLLYEARTMLPLLSGEQEECSSLSLPCEIMGSAGSGKSSIAVEIYRKNVIANPNIRILYVANNPSLVRHIRDCLSQAGVSNPECLTFGELSTSNYHYLNTANRDTFTEFRNSLFETKFSAVEKDIFAMCFDSGIKGNAQLAETGNRLISKDIFINETAKKENIAYDYASLIYELAVKYDRYLQENEIWDSNDLARRLLYRTHNPAFQKYDVVLADEIQDMTGMQVQALIRCCKNYNICFFGDRNQVIVPSTFDFGELEKGIYGKLDGKVTVQRVLKKTYRCGEHLINYLNRLNMLRREKIGAGSQEDDAFEESMRGDADSSMIAVLVTDPGTCQKFLRRAKETAQCSIIVDNKDTLKELASGENLPNIITVEDAKGLEYNIVVLYNFVKDNYSRFKEIFDGSGMSKRSTLHRIVFNKYYVSCTRAVDRIVICEDSGCAEEFKDCLFDGLDEKNDILELMTYLNPSEESWLAEAIRLYSLGKYQQAADYLKKYASFGNTLSNVNYEKYKDLCECQLMLEKSKDAEDWRHCAEAFELYGDFSSARNVYENYLGDRYGVFRIDLMTDNAGYYLNHPEETSKIISSATISNEDFEAITSSMFIEKQMNHLISGVSGILEVMQNGK